MLLKLNITDLLRSKKLSFNKSKGHIMCNICTLTILEYYYAKISLSRVLTATT